MKRFTAILALLLWNAACAEKTRSEGSANPPEKAAAADKKPPKPEKKAAKAPAPPRSATIDGLRWRPMKTSYLGCLKACLDHLGIDHSTAWLSGGVGLAFVINVHETVCPSGPTAWDREAISRLGENLGFKIKRITYPNDSKNFSKRQKRLWREIRGALDDGVPCFGWGLERPEYYVVYGYDRKSYLYSGPNRPAGGRITWSELGEENGNFVEMNVVRKGKESASSRAIVADALAFAVSHADHPNKWTFPKYKTGPAAYDAWINALTERTVDPVGIALNAAVWMECRRQASSFLSEAKEKLHDEATTPLFEKAIKNYQVVAESLKRVSELFPLDETTLKQKKANVNNKNRRYKAIAYLKVAKKAEKAGLANAREIVAALKGSKSKSNMAGESAAAKVKKNGGASPSRGKKAGAAKKSNDSGSTKKKSDDQKKEKSDPYKKRARE